MSGISRHVSWRDLPRNWHVLTLRLAQVTARIQLPNNGGRFWLESTTLCFPHRPAALLQDRYESLRSTMAVVAGFAVEKQEVLDRIVEILRPLAKNKSAFEGISESTSLSKDLEVNSARLVDLVLALEDDFGIEVDDDAAEGVETVGDVINLVAHKLG